MARWLAPLPVLVLLGLVALFAGYGLHHDPRVSPAALVGKPLPDLALKPLDGSGPPRSLRADLHGPAVVNLFASWCVPCAAEAPYLMALKARGVRIIGVAYKDDPAAAKAFLERNGQPYTEVLSDSDGRAGVELGISGVPESFMVGADGRVRSKRSGPLVEADVALVPAELTSTH